MILLRFPKDKLARSWIPVRVETVCLMPEKTFLIRFKLSDLDFHTVIAAKAEIHGDHLVFLRADGSLAALFLMDLVQSWSEVDPKGSHGSIGNA